MVNCRTVISFALIAIFSILTGCASHAIDINERLASLDENLLQKPNAEYKVDPPDALRIEFFQDQSISREVTVRQDGIITLPYINEIHVARLTPAQIAEKLVEAYTPLYNDPRALVTVAAYRSKHILVSGEVFRPGRVPYTGSQSVADIIAEVGGVTHFAAIRRVTVTRGDLENPKIFYVNLDELLYKGDRTQDVSLAEDDVVHVPPSALAWIGYRMDELLFPFRGILSALATSRAIGVTGQ